MQKERRFIVDILFVLALFGLFAVSALILVTIGAGVYKHTVDDMSSNFEARTSISYIAEKIRQNDANTREDGVQVAMLSGKPTIALEQEINDEIYCTYLYFDEGSLKELFMKKDADIGDDYLSAGQKIMELRDFSAQVVSDRLLHIQITMTDGTPRELYIGTHCSQ